MGVKYRTVVCIDQRLQKLDEYCAHPMSTHKAKKQTSRASGVSSTTYTRMLNSTDGGKDGANAARRRIFTALPWATGSPIRE